MKTKEEVIREAWVNQVGLKRYEALKNDLINDGFLHYQPSDLKDSEIKTKDGFLFYRPKSLQGIENNNGWIRIESEADLPKEDMMCFVYDSFYNEVRTDDFYLKNGYFSKSKYMRYSYITHYQPIVKPNKPLY